MISTFSSFVVLLYCEYLTTFCQLKVTLLDPDYAKIGNIYRYIYFHSAAFLSGLLGVRIPVVDLKIVSGSKLV